MNCFFEGPVAKDRSACAWKMDRSKRYDLLDCTYTILCRMLEYSFFVIVILLKIWRHAFLHLGDQYLNLNLYARWYFI